MGAGLLDRTPAATAAVAQAVAAKALAPAKKVVAQTSPASTMLADARAKNVEVDALAYCQAIIGELDATGKTQVTVLDWNDTSRKGSEAMCDEVRDMGFAAWTQTPRLIYVDVAGAIGSSTKAEFALLAYAYLEHELRHVYKFRDLMRTQQGTPPGPRDLRAILTHERDMYAMSLTFLREGQHRLLDKTRAPAKPLAVVTSPALKNTRSALRTTFSGAVTALSKALEDPDDAKLFATALAKDFYPTVPRVTNAAQLLDYVYRGIKP